MAITLSGLAARARPGAQTMPLLNRYVRKRKIDYFVDDIPKASRIFEVGCADGWLGRYLNENGWRHYVGLDLTPPADIVGNILDWKGLGIREQSFDVIIAFEVIEHVSCFQELFDMLVPGGSLLLSSPIPHMDWLLKIFEKIGLTQKRTSPHDHIVYFKDIPLFEPVEVRTVGCMAQWGKFRRPG